MNRKQWFVLGIGLILSGIFMGAISGINNCLAQQKVSLDLVEEAIDSHLSIEFINGAMANSNAWAISCLDMNINLAIISTISWTLGILFIICGFLEPKELKK